MKSALAEDMFGVQVGCCKLKLLESSVETAWCLKSVLLKLKCDKVLSSCPFSFNLCRYVPEHDSDGSDEAGESLRTRIRPTFNLNLLLCVLRASV